MALYKLDLMMLGLYSLDIVKYPYFITDNWKTKMRKTLQSLHRTARQRIKSLIYGYYLGELLYQSITPREKWLQYLDNNPMRNEYYFYLGSTRIFQLFENNINQIYQTQHFTFRTITRLSRKGFNELKEFEA